MRTSPSLVRSLKRLALGVALVAATSVAGTATAGAGPLTMAVSPGFGPPRSAIQVAGSGFRANRAVTVSFDGQALSTVTTDASGGYAATVEVPASARPGPHTVGVSRPGGQAKTRSFTVRTNWWQEGQNASHTGTSAGENVLSKATAPDLSVAWHEAEGASGITGGVAVVNGLTYFASTNGFMWALDTATGRTVWQSRYESFATGAPAVADGVVYMAGSDGTVIAFDAATGVEQWGQQLSTGANGSVTVADGTIYFASDHLYALEPTYGNTKWMSEYIGGSSTPTLDRGLIILSAGDRVHAYDAATGAERWTTPLASEQASATPTVVAGVVYLPAGSDGVYAIDEATGAILWYTRLGCICNLSSPAVADGIMVFNGSDQFVRAVNLADGTPRWQIGSATDGRSAPVSANGVVYQFESQTGVLRALDLNDGRILKSLPLGRTSLLATPAISDGVVYVGTYTDGAYAIR